MSLSGVSPLVSFGVGLDNILGGATAVGATGVGSLCGLGAGAE